MRSSIRERTAETWLDYTGVRTRIAPEATAEQLQALHARVLQTSPVGAILARPISIEAELAT